MSDYEEHVALLRRWCEAYPVDIFPVPPEELRAKDAVAADVLREVALPQFARDADAIESLSSEVARLRAERDAAREALDEALDKIASGAGRLRPYGNNGRQLVRQALTDIGRGIDIARADLSSGGAPQEVPRMPADPLTEAQRGEGRW